jgi:hypothetical protein
LQVAEAGLAHRESYDTKGVSREFYQLSLFDRKDGLRDNPTFV